MQLSRFPSDADLAEAYADAASDDYVEEEAGQRETARRILAEIERHAPRGALVDLGCWVGFLLAEARERGWDAVGVEPSGVRLLVRARPARPRRADRRPLRRAAARTRLPGRRHGGRDRALPRPATRSTGSPDCSRPTAWSR